jgi:hypothetical protein
MEEGRTFDSPLARGRLNTIWSYYNSNIREFDDELMTVTGWPQARTRRISGLLAIHRHLAP